MKPAAPPPLVPVDVPLSGAPNSVHWPSNFQPTLARLPHQARAIVKRMQRRGTIRACVANASALLLGAITFPLGTPRASTARVSWMFCPITDASDRDHRSLLTCADALKPQFLP